MRGGILDGCGVGVAEDLGVDAKTYIWGLARGNGQPANAMSVDLRILKVDFWDIC